MKWNNVRLLLEYFDDYSSEEFKDLVDYVEGLSSEQISEFNHANQSVKNKFLESYFEAVIEFSKFETFIQDDKGLENGKYVTRTTWNDKKHPNLLRIKIIDQTVIDSFNDLFERLNNTDLINNKIKNVFNQLINIRNKLFEMFDHEDDYIYITREDIEKHIDLINQYRNLIHYMSTYDFDDIISYVEKNRHSTSGYLTTSPIHMFILHSITYLDELNDIIRPNTMFTANFYKSHVYEAISKMSNNYVPYSLRTIAECVRKIYWLFHNVFKNTLNSKDASFDTMSHLPSSSEQLKIFREIEQKFVEIAEELDIM